MKSIAFFLGIAFFAVLQGEESCCQNISLQEDKIPYFGDLYYDNVLPAKIREKDRKHENLHYQIGGVYAGSMFFYHATCEEGLAATLGYDWTYLCWKGNPSFDQCNFQYLSFSLSGFSKRFDDWVWKANATMLIDPTHFDWEHYLAWDLLLWGRYAYNQDVGLHLGFYAITGMHIDRVYPVLGIDWTRWEPFTLSIVFPFDMSAIWKLDDHWDIGVAVRFFQSRHRVDKKEPLPQALWLYTSYGGEATLNYHFSDFIHANFHAGINFGGELKIADRHWDNPRHFKTGYAPCAGGEISLSY